MAAALRPLNLPIVYETELDQLKIFFQVYKSAAPAAAATSNHGKGKGKGKGMTSSGSRRSNAMDLDMYDNEDDMDIDAALEDSNKPKYMKILEDIAERRTKSLVFDMDDLIAHSSEGDRDSLVRNMMRNTKRYTDLISRAADSLMPPPSKNAASVDEVIDVILEQRRQRDEAARAQQEAMMVDSDGEDGGAEAAAAALEKLSMAGRFPPSLVRRYTVFIRPPTRTKAVAVRDVSGFDIGRLVNIRGLVTKVTDVKPLMTVCTYSCDKCGYETFQEVRQTQYLPLQNCTSEKCVKNRTGGRLQALTRGSRFLRFQEIKVQEMHDQVPTGDIPRSVTVHLFEDLTRTCVPGDHVVIGGVFLAKPYTGFRALRAGLIADTYLEAMHVHQLKKQYAQLTADANAESDNRIANELTELSVDPHIYERLAASISPEIFGHEDVKKALLLLLVGAPTKATEDGMTIRGDINICLMGDPGVAKSQLLRFIHKIAPRSQYTTGKGSSGVGLTSSVTRDPITEEMILEGGALVLADNGICCIDEFDKMEDSDRTAIHEVMEQQTISISKAGITTTLNARTSILAAANPSYGRYNKKLSPSENINLPAALLSRFDILFLMLDQADPTTDLQLAKHITHVHMTNEHPPLPFQPVDANIMRHYIARARTFTPSVTPETADYIVGAYVTLRQQYDDLEKRVQQAKRNVETAKGGMARAIAQAKDASAKGAVGHVTARTLLGIVRLAQAHARLRLSNLVTKADVEEALRLMTAAKQSLLDDAPAGGVGVGVGAGAGGRRQITDYKSVIYQLIRGMAVRVREYDDGEDVDEDDSNFFAKRAAKTSSAAATQTKSKKTQSKGKGKATSSSKDGDAMMLDMKDIENEVSNHGYSQDQLQTVLDEYSALNLFSLNRNRTKLTFVQ
ncbi:MCM-domain-containing protein [Ramicandelaber brevisporus]|nr:MCM-domain-containing protein [Ramicandelaber brevisporus]